MGWKPWNIDLGTCKASLRFIRDIKKINPEKFGCVTNNDDIQVHFNDLYA